MWDSRLGYLKALVLAEEISDTVPLQWSNITAYGKIQPSTIHSVAVVVVGIFCYEWWAH
jgi:hypothetical protein